MKRNRGGANMGVLLGESTRRKSSFKRAVFSVDFLPVRKEELFAGRPDLVNVTREITFTYGLRKHFTEETSDWWGNVAPHFILSIKDECLLNLIMNPQHRNFGSWADFLAKSEQNAVLRLLRECSNLNEDMFAVAVLNPFVVFHVAIDVSKYLAKVGAGTSFVTSDIMEDRFVSRDAEKARAYLKAKYGGWDS